VTLLRSGSKLGQSPVDRALLGIDETLEIMWVGLNHAGIMGVGSPARKGAGA